MARIVAIDIKNFRGISDLTWLPQAGINCLIGPGDSGKSTILEAIDWCLGARRSIKACDADFFGMNVEVEIAIEIAIGDLDASLLNLEQYGLFLRGFNSETRQIEDEPADGLETVLSLKLTVGNDLEPVWKLVSDRAADQGVSRSLSWADRMRIAPSRIGSYSAYHLGWQHGSVLTRLSDETAVSPEAFAAASRSARESFGDSVGEQLTETLGIVKESADRLGVECGDHVRALLDAHSVSLSGGTISLHNEQGVPLRSLGSGSSRLLVAGLQHSLARRKSIALVDEVEFGLEPHRISRLLTALGSKEATPKLQVFMTTHSPVVLRELSSQQMHVVRCNDGRHVVLAAGETDGVQGALRSSSEAFLGSRVLVCEGATEVGLIRGLDLFRDDNRKATLGSLGTVPIDACGVSRIYGPASSIAKLGYPVGVLRDDDQPPKADEEEPFLESGGVLFKWSAGKAIEDELFSCVSDELVATLVRFAMGVRGDDLVAEHLRTASGGPVSLETWLDEIDETKRTVVARAAKSGAWFKRISVMEAATRNHIAPDLANIDARFAGVITGIYKWAGVEDA